MEVQFGPNSVDEPNLLYKLQRKIRVFNTSEPLPNRGYNLVASSSKYGFVFVAVPDGLLTVYYLNQLVDSECKPLHVRVQLQEKPTHISVSCDYELLAVTGGQLLCIYKVADFQNSNVAPSVSIRTEANPSTFVSALQWNPCIPDSIAIAYFDGTLVACLASSGQIKKVPSKARCICWSPKGKQLVTGNSDGTLIQYKPDLTPAKIVPVPNLFEGCPVEAMAIYWISTFQFAVVYKNATDNSRPAVTIVNTPKAGQPSCISYEDICYSTGSNRPWFYYLQGLAQWNIIMTSSSNSMEIGTLGSVDGVNWVQWSQTDEARLELPLTNKKMENYPVGISIDTCAIHQLSWGENETLPHMPLIHVISQNGLLATFNIINLKKDAVPMCSPPQLLTLPAHALFSTFHGEESAEPAAAPTPTPTSEVEVSALHKALQPAAPVTQPAIKIPSYTPPNNLGFSTAPANQVPDQPPVLEIKPAPVVPQPQIPPAQIKPQPAAAPKAQPTPQQTQENAALKAEQDKLNKIKANQELKNMLVKEVNDFQMELYNFTLKTRETQARLQRDIETINANFNGISLDSEQLKKECSIDDLRGAVVQLKLELVRACAVVAEARTHSEAKDLHEWSQADPLTIKRVASVKKLAYYVQSQLEQAHKALDYKWNEYASRDSQTNKPEKRMIRPILDDVYQPLVKQQEILGRQQAVLRTMKKALNDCDIGPVFKSTSLLRSTPFRNNKDPLSKLTKNILNMSIEPQTKSKQSLLTAQKLDALRDVLSNHKTVKIKPVNVELRQHLAAMRKNYDKSVQGKAQTVPVKAEPDFTPQYQPVPPQPIVQVDKKPEPLKQTASAPGFMPLGNLKPMAGLPNVARTLFTDEPKQEMAKVHTHVQRPVSKAFGFTPTTVAEPATDTKSVLKDILTNKQANLEARNSGNTFMGQKICSPTALAPAPISAPTAVFTSKPIADMSNMFNKFQPQPIVPETKSKLNVESEKSSTGPNVKSSETGEPEETADVSKPFELKHKDKPITNLFAMKTTPVAANTPVAPAVTKTPVQDQKAEIKISVKPLEKLTEKTKENVPEKSSENVTKTVHKVPEKKEALKPLSSQTTNKNFVFGTAEPTEPPSVSASTLKPQSSFPTLPATIKTEAPPTHKTESDSKPTDLSSSSSSASSIFGSAITSQPKPSSSIFSASPTAQSSPTSVFGSIKPSIFNSTTPGLETQTTSTSVFGQTNTTQSVFSSTAASVFASASNPQPSIPSAIASNVEATTTAAAPVLSTTTTAAASVFASATSTSVFGTTSSAPAFGTTTSVFGTPTPSSPSSVFGATTTASAASVFGTTPTTQASVFGSSEAAPSAFTPTTTSIFGTATTTAASIFSPQATTQASVFGQAAPSVFGATTQASVFGTAGTQSSVFGSSTTPTSVFGSTTPTTQGSVFGTPTQTTQASIFGTPPPTTQGSVFGTPTQASQASVFGTPTQITPASVFGTTQTTQASIFGQPATTAQNGSLFGGGEANLFASASISTTSAPTPGNPGNIFGSSSSGSVFGGGSTNVFGGKAAFGQPSAASANIFGGGASFGQKPATSFWGSGNTTASGFGSTGFGQQATTQASSIFGGTTGGSFSQPSSGAFGAPTQPTGFGSPQPQQQASGFGGSSVFGSKPAFGQPSGFGSSTSGAFGSPAAFGGFNQSPSGGGFGAPAFGGGGGGFGGSSPGSGFGTPTQSNATFESLATQNTLTFGNLAQQSAPAQQAAPSFNTSPSFTGWRG